MNIGQAAAATGLSAKMIRYYEQIGLLRKPLRTDGNYRHFSDNDLHDLRFLQRGRSLGFSLEQIAHLLSLWHDDSRESHDVKALALAHMAELERKIAELAAMADTLRQLAARCTGDDRPDCPILNELGGQGSGTCHPVE